MTSTTVTIDNKSKVTVFAVLAALATCLPILIGFTVWITSVAADAKKGAKAASKVTEIYYDVKAIKKQLNVKDEPIPPRDLDSEEE